MDLENLLNKTQQGQLAKAIKRILDSGFGVLEVRVEKGMLRWLKPGRAIFNPAARPVLQDGAEDGSSLGEILGPWKDSFCDELANVLGDCFGTLYVGVDHGRIRYIMASCDEHAHTGKTGEMDATTLQS